MQTSSIVFFSLMGVSLLLNAYMHGKPRSNNDFWSALLSLIIIILLVGWMMKWNF